MITIIVLNQKFNLPYGVIKISKINNSIDEINEKRSIKFMTNSGIYIISPLLLKKIKKKNINFDIIQLIDFCRSRNIRVNYYSVKSNQWHDTGSWSNYEKTVKSF